MGRCHATGCTAEAVVEVNGFKACVDHIDQAMAPISDIVREMKELSDG